MHSRKNRVADSLYVPILFQIDLFGVFMMLVAYGHPIYIWLYCRKEKAKDKKRQLNPIYKPTGASGLVVEDLCFTSKKK